MAVIACLAVAPATDAHAQQAAGAESVLAALHQRGMDAYESGDFAECIDSWKQARALAKREGLTRVEVPLLVNMAQAYQSMGNPALAYHTLNDAEKVAGPLNDEDLMLKIRGVRGAIGAFGDASEKAPNARRGAGEDGPGQEWAGTQLGDLLHYLESPQFPKPAPNEWREAMAYFKNHRSHLLRGRDDDLTGKPLVTQLKRAEKYATRRPSEASRIIRDEAEPLAESYRSASRKSESELREIVVLYAQLASNLESEDRETALACAENVMALRPDPFPAGETAWASVRVDIDRAVAMVPATSTVLVAMNTASAAGVSADDDVTRVRHGSSLESLLSGSSGYALAGKDREMMRRLASDELPGLIDLARLDLAILVDSPGEDGASLKQEAMEALARADHFGEALFGAELALKLKQAYGAGLAFGGNPDAARIKPEQDLLAGWAAAQRSGDTGLEAAALNDLGTSLSARGKDEIAALCFAQASRFADESGDRELASRALLNRAKATGSGADRARAASKIGAMDATHAKSLMLLSLGKSYDEHGQLSESYKYLKEALETARGNGDPWTASYALGMLGNVYLSQGRHENALALTRRALFLSQEQGNRSRDLSFRWTWQTGRILNQLGRRDEALAAYLRANGILETVRQDIVIAYGRGGIGATFREEIGSFYFELADLHLAMARRDPETRAENLLEARSAVEAFKAALLEDYFRDRSIATYRQRGLTSKASVKRVGEVARQAAVPTAVVYYIPLPTRTEILVEVGDGAWEWKTADIGSAALGALAGQLRAALDPLASESGEGSTAYMKPARRLYDLLIRPIESRLAAEGVQTLVVVPDGELRSIPMAALHDGRGFLVERYALATVPDLLLMDEPSGKKPQGGRARNPLRVGLSKSVQGFSGLPAVEGEIERLGDELEKQVEGGRASSRQLVNENYTKRSFIAAFRDDFDLVHIASHASFSTDLDDTFVLTYEDKIGLGDLEKSMRRVSFRERPVDLLVLSACETAVGGDRAALGLAGVAVKSGTHSVVASLWPVNDNAASDLITRFYANFLGGTPLVSKAEALRSAQLETMKAWPHPRDWAPFIVIGNWLAPEERIEIYRTLDAEQSRISSAR